MPAHDQMLRIVGVDRRGIYVLPVSRKWGYVVVRPTHSAIERSPEARLLRRLPAYRIGGLPAPPSAIAMPPALFMALPFLPVLVLVHVTP